MYRKKLSCEDKAEKLPPAKCCQNGRCKPYVLNNLLWRHYFSSNHPGTFLPVYHQWTPPRPPAPGPCPPDSLCEALKTDPLLQRQPEEPKELRTTPSSNWCSVCHHLNCGSGPDRCKNWTFRK